MDSQETKLKMHTQKGSTGKSVLVLLSSYNGEKYIREQIDSVLNQNGVELHLLIRDDGSKDSTLSILEEYSKADRRVSYFAGANMGPCQSFFDLAKNADKYGEYDYYAFCDQDDYWEENKLRTAITFLQKLPNDSPALYCSNLKVVDSSLSFVHYAFHKPKNTSNRYIGLVDFYAVGCTEVFNSCTRQMLINHFSSQCLMHDSWVFLIALFFGNVYYDHNSHILYRQHGNNVIGNSVSKWRLIKDRYKRLIDSSCQPRLSSATAFFSEFSDMLGPEDSSKIYKMVNYRSSLSSLLRLFFDFQLRSNSILGDLRYRLLILLQRI